MSRTAPRTMKNPALAALALGSAAFFVAPSQAQVRLIDNGESLNTGRSQTVVVTQRPLRTLGGQAVRVGRFSSTNDSTSIGVVRARRNQPIISSVRRGTYSDINRSDRSDRWYQRELALGRIATPFQRNQDLSIGVVRAFRNDDPIVRLSPQTFTNPNAANVPGANTVNGPVTVGPSFASPPQAGDADIYAVTRVELPEADRDNAWALFDQGFYREAATRFTGDDPVSQTGAALAAALSGDLNGAAQLMPATPQVPVDTVLQPATRQRIEQTRRFLYSDNATMQSALQSILDTTAPADAV
ncbi:MAG: hypothetical protein AAGG38_04785 [Planctomycetota bacterium]